jgi:aldose 1-epimerase
MSAGAVVLRSDALELHLLPELGARIHRLRAFGHDLLRVPDDPATHATDPFSWGAYPMAPWCNRAPAGRRQIVAGRLVDLVPNFPDGTAIHGLVATRPWRQLDDRTFEIVRDAGSEWPWPFVLRLAATVREATASLEYRLTNLADEPMLAGLGLHPWFRRPLELRIPATAVYESNVASEAQARPVGAATDLRTLAAPGAGLDGTWTALDEPVLQLRWPDLRVGARLDIAAAGSSLVAVASPEGIGAVAVEPQTHGPDPFRRLERGEPDAPVLLAPHAELYMGLTLSFDLARDVPGTEGVWSGP